jgi:hypothetical protein
MRFAIHASTTVAAMLVAVSTPTLDNFLDESNLT